GSEYKEDLGENIKFRVKVVDKDDYKFLSEGQYNDINKEITFNLRYGDGYNSVNIQGRGETDHFNFTGGGDLLKYIGVRDFNNKDDWKEFVKEILGEDFFTRDDVKRDPDNTNRFEDTIAEVKDNINSTTIENSIVVIEGSLGGPGGGPGKVEIKNSVVVVKDWIDIRGGSSIDDWEEPMIYIFADSKSKNDYYFDVRGTGDFDIIPRDLPEDFDLKIRVHNWQQQ
ncbi:MAG: hypothetical protein ACOCRK_09625, partial [bacterium]